LFYIPLLFAAFVLPRLHCNFLL